MSRAIRGQATSDGVRRAGLWFGFVGGGFAWTLHLMTAYAIAEFGCVGGLGTRFYGNISLVAWMHLLATALAVCLAATATAVAYRIERHFQRHVPDEAQAASEKYTARLGLIANGFFTFVIVFESIPIFFYLRDC
jgi:hypothetical protein